MKKLLLLGILFLFPRIYSQSSSSLDDMLTNVNQSSVTSGIIYERTAQFANLYNFNKASDYNTANSKMFIQALAEMYNASNKAKFISNDALKLLTKSTYQSNTVDLGILNTPFHALNYSEENPSQGGLTLDATTNKFAQISGKDPFLALHTTVISPLKEYVKGNSITYKIRNDLYFKNTYKNIKTLTANFGDGVSRNLITNEALANQSIIINYTTEGTKTLVFTVTYDDNSTLTTNAKIFVKFETAPVYYRTTGVVDNLIDNETIQSEEAFQGYDEPFAFRGKIDYRIFYHTNNSNTQKKMLKPIIIIDGFDPGDKRKIQKEDYDYYVEGEDRSIEDMMKYNVNVNGTNQKNNLIGELRNKGFDVIIVNNPTYCVNTTAPYALATYDKDNNTCREDNARLVNGGADYIERNALNLVALIKNFNARVAANGSTEKLVIVGPSMGGQISRYALAYMEKKGWQHNTRLWISVDSPHLGANIPVGVQTLVYLLRDESPAAKDFYDYQLGSPAAKQQLIESHKELTGTGFRDWLDDKYLNGKTVSQGFTSNNGNPFFTRYYDAQFANGLSNSKGYPQNLRKISIVNGSLSGSKNAVDGVGNLIGNYGGDSQQTINVRGFEHLCFFYCWKVHVASMETYTMPALSTSAVVARFKSGFNDKYIRASNNNLRGNMDTVSGGYFDAYNILVKEIMGESVSWMDVWPLGFYFGFGESVNLELRTNKMINSFIPTFSALGITNPDRNWGENLQRNLVCTNETPFDSYYGASDNTQHTSFTEESVNWMMKELDGNLQAPNFPIDVTQFTGSNTICLNTTTTYGFVDACKLPSNVTWSINSSNAQIVSSTASSVVLKGISNGAVTLTAKFQNGQEFTKKIWVGIPNIYLDPDPDNTNYVTFYAKSTDANVTLDEQGLSPTNVEWRRLDNNQIKSGYSYFTIFPNYKSSFDLEIKATNSCGTFTTYATISPPPPPNCDGYKVAKSGKGNNAYIIIDPCAKTSSTTSKLNNITTEIYDTRGTKILQTNNLEFSLDNQLPGAYYLRIIKNNNLIHTETILKN